MAPGKKTFRHITANYVMNHGVLNGWKTKSKV